MNAARLRSKKEIKAASPQRILKRYAAKSMAERLRPYKFNETGD